MKRLLDTVLIGEDAFYLPATCADPRAPRRREPPTPGPDLPPGQ